MIAFLWTNPLVLALGVAIVGAGIGAAFTALLSRRDSNQGTPPAPKEDRVGKTPNSIEWKSEPIEYGVLYRSGHCDAELLMILVHGILGSPIGTWGSLPKLLRVSTNLPFDVLSYGYPAGLLHSASIESGAKSLSTALKKGRFKGYKHLIFATHSTGGLLLKHILIDDFAKTLNDLSDGRKRFDDIESIAFRSRQIINIAVPHTGGSFFATCMLIPLYHALLPALGITMFIDMLLRRIGVRSPLPKGYTYGYNRIVWQLRWRNRDLSLLEDRYRRLVQGFDRERLPRPVAIEINGTEDSAIDRSADDIRIFSAKRQRKTSAKDEPLVFRGSHPSVKRASSPNDTIVAFIAGFLHRYSTPLDVIVASDTIKRSLTLDRSIVLIGAESINKPEAAEWSEKAVEHEIKKEIRQ
jgi:hypothetical protein